MPNNTTDTIAIDRPEELWTIDQAAEFIGVSDDTARPLLEDVAIRFSKRLVRYDPRDVWSHALARKGTADTEAAPTRSERPTPARPFTPSGGVVRRRTTVASDEDVAEDEEAA